MILPKNGRIVIVDDNINEVKPLMRILSKRRIPFNYYSGTDYTEFPENTDENKLRVLFLDLNIFELVKDPKNVISSIDGILRAIIPDNPNPYLLIIWSKLEKEYKNVLEQHFIDKIPNKTPAKIIFLQKGEYFDWVDGNWQPQDDSVKRIEEKLTDELQKISLLRNLIYWENIVHQKTSETVNEFSSFYPIDNDWDKNSKAIMYSLAKAIIGKDDIGESTDEQKLATAFTNLSSFLFEKVENEIEDVGLDIISNVNENGVSIPNLIISAINSKLHLSQKLFTINKFEQGNLYFLPNQDDLIERILWNKKFKQTIRQQILDSNPQLIQLDLTPVCDYFQDKEYVRTIFGIILSNEFYDNCHNKGLIYYQTPSILIDDIETFVFLDFRFIRTFTKEEIINRNITPSLKLRKEICTDIQSQLANQINRPGISNL